MTFTCSAFQRPIQLLFLLGLCSAGLIFSGCGDRNHGVPITGMVSFQGQPLADGSIAFFPVKGRPVISSLDSQGSYSVRLLPGTYEVTVGVGTDFPEGWKEGDPSPPPRIALPAIYTIRARTQLSTEVAENHSEPINFDLQ